ncbi:MAG: Na/Pi cotransporter family protein [Endomicrobia bacterium]|nr:Na/Pi cotransporter family protein [Endomicrobiia bacterium]MCL2145316.1 Na/Pi cotransporter family protein [Endomicrobiia bacterium]
MNKIKLLSASILLFLSCAVFASENRLTLVSGDGQTGIRGYPLKNDFVVRITGQNNEPAKNIKVDFSIIRANNDNSKKGLSNFEAPHVYTDEDGYARAKLILGKNALDEIIVMASSDDASGNVVFNSVSFNKNWLPMMIVNIAGGLALLLFGMAFINNALQKAAGHKFRSVLTSLTSSKLKGVASGFLMTALNQSSSATVLLIVSLVSAGLLSFFQSMSVVLGASIGSTITGQLVAFRLINFALPIVALGFFVSFVSGGKRISEIGDAIFGFGILFFGMKLMSDAMVPVTLNPVFLDFMAQIQSPVFGILAGIMITVIIQSSGAVVGIVIALAATNVITLNQAVCLALGSQIGTCITVVIGTVKLPRNAKRVMIWQVVQQTLAVILVFPFLQWISVNGEGVWFIFVKRFTKTFFFTEDIGRQIAMSHTLVAVFNAAIMFPVLKYLQKMIFFFYPFKNSEIAFGTIYIDIKNVEKNADKALEFSKKEIQRLAEFVLDMLKFSIKALKTRNIEIPESISYKAMKIDLLSKEIVPYIAKVGQKRLSEQQSKTEIELLYILSDLDEISDIIDRNLMHIARKKIRGYSRFSDEGIADIKKIHAAVYDNLAKAINAFNTNDAGLAKEVSDSKPAVRIFVAELRQKHIARLHANLQESIETSGLHMDILDQYTRINSIICDIGRILSQK